MSLTVIALTQVAAMLTAGTVAVLVERHERRRLRRAIADARPRLPMPQVPQQRRPTTYLPVGEPLTDEALTRLLAQLGPCQPGTNCAGHANKTCRVAPCCATCPTDPPEVTP